MTRSFCSGMIPHATYLMDGERDAKRPRIDNAPQLDVGEGGSRSESASSPEQTSVDQSNAAVADDELKLVSDEREDISDVNLDSDVSGEAVSLEIVSDEDNMEESAEDAPEDDAEAELEELVDELEKSMDYKGSNDPAGRRLVELPSDVSRDIRKDLFRGGALLWLNKYRLQSQQYTAPELLSALGFPLPHDILENFSSKLLELGLQIAIRHVLSKRRRLSAPRTLDQLADAINRASNIVVVTGAGISTSLGIPDFRSDNGLYAQLSYLGLADPQEVFDIRLFRDDPSIFYSVARKLLPDEKRFSPAHHFIRMLQDRGKLLRNYTQNIDNLEQAAGIRAEKIVQCHGSFGTAYCFTCGRDVTGESIFPAIRAGEIPRCSYCKPPKNDDEFDDASYGVMKPGITFFGEGLPKRFEHMLFDEMDAAKCDLLICMGTSLKVAPVSEVVKVVDPEVPQIYISRTPALHCVFEMCFFGSCDDVVELLCAKLEWPFKHEMAKRDSDLPLNEFPIAGGNVGKIESDDGYYNFMNTEESTLTSDDADGPGGVKY